MNGPIFLALLLSSCVYICLGNEKQLINDLLKDYDRRVRPVKDPNSIVTVGVQMMIIRLLEVNGKEEYIKLTMFLKQEWKDEYLHWDPEKYGGIDYIRIAAKEVWLPDIVLVTSSNEAEDMIPREDVLVGINHTGAIDYAYAFVHYNACPMDSQKFPFDSQKCILKVTSWKHPMNRMHVVHTLANNSKPRNPNTEWELFPYTNETRDWHRELSTEVYRQVWYTFSMKRRSTYFVWVIIVPTFVISALSIAGIFCPVNNTGERSEKVTLGLTTLLTLAVILSLVTGDMPKGMNLPVLGIFVLAELIICTSSMAISVAILYLHQRAVVRGWIPPKYLIIASQGEQVVIRKNTYHYQYRNSIQPTIGNGEVKTTVVSDLSELRKSMTQVTDAIAPVKKYLEKVEEDTFRNDQWGLIFDRIDIVFFILFQLINGSALLYVYIASW